MVELRAICDNCGKEKQFNNMTEFNRDWVTLYLDSHVYCCNKCYGEAMKKKRESENERR